MRAERFSNNSVSKCQCLILKTFSFFFNFWYKLGAISMSGCERDRDYAKFTQIKRPVYWKTAPSVLLSPSQSCPSASLKLFQIYSTLIYKGTLQNQEITAKSEIIGYGKAHKEPSNSDLKLLPSLDSPICSVIVKIAPSSHHTSGISKLKNSHLPNKAMKSIAGLKKSVVNIGRARKQQ